MVGSVRLELSSAGIDGLEHRGDPHLLPEAADSLFVGPPQMRELPIGEAVLLRLQ